MHQQKIEQSPPLQEHPPRDFDTSVVFSIRGNTFSAQFDISFITGVQCGGCFARMSTYDWQPKAMPQMGRQRNTPSMCTILTCPSHQPLSSPCLNEDSTIWEEGGKGGTGVMDWTKMKTRLERPLKEWLVGAMPKLTANEQLKKAINEDSKT